MENPEKIYLASFDEKPDVLDRTWYWEKQYKCYNTEYIRTDAFIEKACDAYCRLCDTKECGDTGECEWVEKFRKRLMRQQ